MVPHVETGSHVTMFWQRGAAWLAGQDSLSRKKDPCELCVAHTFLIWHLGSTMIIDDLPVRTKQSEEIDDAREANQTARVHTPLMSSTANQCCHMRSGQPTAMTVACFKMRLSHY
eukprot:1978359-Amphidinium_carterae.1